MSETQVSEWGEEQVNGWGESRWVGIVRGLLCPNKRWCLVIISWILTPTPRPEWPVGRKGPDARTLQRRTGFLSSSVPHRGWTKDFFSYLAVEYSQLRYLFFVFFFFKGDSYLHPWATRNAIIFLDVFDKSRQNWCHFSAAGNRLWGIYQHPIHPPRVTYHRPPSAPGWPQWPAGIGAKIGRPKIVPVPIFNL